MIIKSMSRKEPSFGQLVDYMSDEKSERAYDLHQHLFSRSPRDIAKEFETNSRLLGKRKGGNFLFHEILSIDTRECGQGKDVKETLRLLALEYIARRCSRSMVYGAMHRDHKDHLHYHLMISANERGSKTRQRFSPGQFDRTKREIECYAREKYPELKQPEVMDQSREDRDKRREERKSQKQQEMEKRGAKLTKKQLLAQELRGLMSYATSRAEFERLLLDRGFSLRPHGKNWVLDPLPRGSEGKKARSHRFRTLGVHQDYLDFLSRVQSADMPEREDETPSKVDGKEKEQTEGKAEDLSDRQKEWKAQSEKRRDAQSRSRDEPGRDRSD